MVLKRKQYMYLFLLFFLVQSEFFYIIPLDNTLVKSILTGISLLLYFFYFVGLLKTRSTKNKFHEIYLLVIIPLFIIIHMIYTKVHYEQGIIDFFKASYHYIFLIWIVPLNYVFEYTGTIKALDKITNLVCFGQLLYFLNTIIYSLTNHNLLFITESFRNDNLRTYVALSMMMIDLSFLSWKVFCLKSKDRKDFLKLSISIFALIFCTQSRFLEITSLFLILFFALYKQNLTKKQLIRIFIIFVAIFGVILSGYVEEFIDTFKIGGLYSGSTSSRLREFEYYFDAFCDNPFTGLGLLATESTLGNYIIRGPLGLNYPTDVGYIGALGNMGVTILMPLLPFYLRWFYLRKRCKRSDDKYYIFCKGLVLFFFINSFSQIMTDPQRILELAVGFAIMESIEYENG